MWARVLVAVAGLTGCLIVPKTEHTPHHVSDETAHVVPPAAAMGLEVATSGGTITMRASQPRVCRRETWSIVDVRHEKTADLEVADVGSSDIGALIAIVLSPITLAVSGLITLAVVSADKPTVTRERHKVRAVPYECPVLRGNVAVTLVFPSGSFVELATDANGVASFVVPAEEPDAGSIEVKANALGPRRVTYDRTRTAPIVNQAPPQQQLPPPADETRAACIERRRQLMLSAQQIDNAKERGRLLQALPVCPAQ